MAKWTAWLFALTIVASVAIVMTSKRDSKTAPRPPSVQTPTDAGANAVDASVPPTERAAASAAPSAAPSAEAPAELDFPADLNAGPLDAGKTLLNGEQPPAVAANAPKSVVFGVVLVQYRGAQGATPNARTREAALELAKELSTMAKGDFKAAVAKGDKGSLDNAGRIPRGMLEAAPEYVLFSLPKDGVSDPVDTPRGFWIVRRIE